MYIPKHFAVTDKDEIWRFIRANAFAQFTSMVDGKLFATHIPFLLSEDGTRLLGHVAKQNPQWESLAGQNVLVTFQGAHDYVSPTWYGSGGVPSWNYQAVHVSGTASITTDPAQLATIVHSLSHVYESGLEQPWEPQYPESMLSAIVGVAVDIDDLQCK